MAGVAKIVIKYRLSKTTGWLCNCGSAALWMLLLWQLGRRWCIWGTKIEFSIFLSLTLATQQTIR
jgi:hypothetical protein